MLKVTKFSLMDWSLICNINRLIGFNCYRLMSIVIDDDYHRLSILSIGQAGVLFINKTILCFVTETYLSLPSLHLKSSIF